MRVFANATRSAFSHCLFTLFPSNFWSNVKPSTRTHSIILPLPLLIHCPADHLTCRALTPSRCHFLCPLALALPHSCPRRPLSGFFFRYSRNRLCICMHILFSHSLLRLCWRFHRCKSNFIFHEVLRSLHLAVVCLELPLQPKIELEKSIVKHINLLAGKLHRGGKFILREMCRQTAYETAQMETERTVCERGS